MNLKQKSTFHLILARTHRDRIRDGLTVMEKGSGVWVFDQDGRRYLDLEAGMTRPVHVGYGRKEIARVAYDQMVRLSYFTPMEYANEPALKLANALSEITPGEINYFFFVSSGSEAVEAAIKLARHYHYFRGERRRYKIISRRGAYHGVTSGALSALGTVLPMRQIMEPLIHGTIFVESPYCYRCPLHLSYPSCEIACARDIERIIQFEDPEQISAFIGEPIQQGFGAYAPPKEYWKIVREICDRYGILLIIDEVICGFGRTGKWFGIEHYDIQPDMITMAKGISSGYVPLGAVGCTDRVIAPIEIFHHLHTYSNHPVACAVAIKNIQILKDENLIDRSKEIGVYFLERLKSLESHSIVGEVRGKGLWTGIDFTPDKEKRTPFPPNRIIRIADRAKNKGLIIKTMGQSLEFAPALVIKKEEIDEAIRILDECLTEEEKAE
ncbi:MAG: aminotransferase family protein [Thermodesulfobacteriota bacterium]